MVVGPALTERRTLDLDLFSVEGEVDLTGGVDVPGRTGPVAERQADAARVEGNELDQQEDRKDSAAEDLQSAHQAAAKSELRHGSAHAD